MEVSDTKALMRAVTWDPTGPLLAVEHDDVRDPSPPELDRTRETRGTAADDDHVRHGVPSRSRAATRAPQ